MIICVYFIKYHFLDIQIKYGGISYKALVV